ECVGRGTGSAVHRERQSSRSARNRSGGPATAASLVRPHSVERRWGILVAIFGENPVRAAGRSRRPGFIDDPVEIAEALRSTGLEQRPHKNGARAWLEVSLAAVVLSSAPLI